jgi:hypothetical protein
MGMLVIVDGGPRKGWNTAQMLGSVSDSGNCPDGRGKRGRVSCPALLPGTHARNRSSIVTSDWITLR